LLLNLEYLEDSPGSLFELYYAFFNHIPVIAFGKSNKNIDLQAHVKESLTICFDNIDDALDYLLYMYSQQ
jgi:nucleoside 2-deoxyribosyltransferase